MDVAVLYRIRRNMQAIRVGHGEHAPESQADGRVVALQDEGEQGAVRARDDRLAGVRGDDALQCGHAAKLGRTSCSPPGNANVASFHVARSAASKSSTGLPLNTRSRRSSTMRTDSPSAAATGSTVWRARVAGLLYTAVTGSCASRSARTVASARPYADRGRDSSGVQSACVWRTRTTVVSRAIRHWPLQRFLRRGQEERRGVHIVRRQSASAPCRSWPWHSSTGSRRDMSCTCRCPC